jgi:hypothetical protein
MSTPRVATTVQGANTKNVASRTNHPQNVAFNPSVWDAATAQHNNTSTSPVPPPQRNTPPNSRAHRKPKTKQLASNKPPGHHASGTETWFDPTSSAHDSVGTKCRESTANQNDAAIIARAVVSAQVQAVVKQLLEQCPPECAECAECAEDDMYNQCAKDPRTASSTTSKPTRGTRRKTLADMQALLKKPNPPADTRCHTKHDMCANDTRTTSSTTSESTIRMCQKTLADMQARLNELNTRADTQCPGGVCPLPGS